MPKRTNEFQRLVHLIYEQLAPHGARVQESVLVMEKGLPNPIEREIDILIEAEVAGELVRIAVECRGRKRKDDIGWIDSLVGKYAHLPIQKIVAVSKSGLTPAAVQKAHFHDIETRILQDALETDWQEEFVRFGLATLTTSISILKVAIISEPSLPEDFDITALMCIRRGSELGTLVSAVQQFSNERTRSFLSERFLKIYNTLTDLRKVALLRIEACPEEELTLLDAEDRTYILKTLIVFLALQNEFRKGQRRYFKLGRAGVSIDNALDCHGSVFRMTSVQVSGEHEARIEIGSVDKLGQDE